MTMRFAIIADLTPDPTAGAAGIALALAGMGGHVTLRAVAPEGAATDYLLLALASGGVPANRIDREPDGVIRKGARMDIYDLFGHDVLVLDFADQPLRRFLTDLPAHTKPDVRMLGTLRHLDTQPPTSDELEIAMRYDTFTGTPGQFMRLTGAASPGEALARIDARMPGTHLRSAVMIGPDAVDIVARDEAIHLALPTTPLAHAIAIIARGMAERWQWQKTAEFICNR